MDGGAVTALQLHSPPISHCVVEGVTVIAGGERDHRRVVVPADLVEVVRAGQARSIAQDGYHSIDGGVQ